MIGLLAPGENREARYRLLMWLLAANWRRPSGHFTIRREPSKPCTRTVALGTTWKYDMVGLLPTRRLQMRTSKVKF